MLFTGFKINLFSLFFFFFLTLPVPTVLREIHNIKPLEMVLLTVKY